MTKHKYNYTPTDGILTISIVGSLPANPLDKLRIYQSLVLVYKALHNLGPSYIREFFKLMAVEYNLWGIGTKLVLPHFNLEWVHKSSYIVTNLWNSLSVKIRESGGTDEFKKSLARSYVLIFLDVCLFFYFL